MLERGWKGSKYGRCTLMRSVSIFWWGLKLELKLFQQDREAEVEKPKILYGMSLGARTGAEDEDEDGDAGGIGTRVVKAEQRVSSVCHDGCLNLMERPPAVLLCRRY